MIVYAFFGGFVDSVFSLIHLYILFVFSLMVYAFFGGLVDVKANVTETAVEGDSIVTHEVTPGIHNFSKCRASTRRLCHVWPLMVEFSGVTLSCFTLSRSTVFMALSLKQKGRLVQLSVPGSYLFSVTGQQTYR